ncbi:hypothetical protein BH11BAC7_BH11BAC7_00480 [soil metagenome]
MTTGSRQLNTDQMSSQRNYYALLTSLFFVAMAVFAVVFAKERFQADGAYYLLKIINYGEFQVEHQRYILAVSQALPLLGSKLGFSMNTIFILNSLNNVVFFYLVFLYAVYFLKDKTAGVAIILFSVFGVLHIQFTPMYEIWYGIILLVLVRAHMVQGRTIFMSDLLLLGAIMITVLFSHPLLFIPLLFVIMFEAIETWRIQWRLFFCIVIVFVSWYMVKKLFLSSYEAGKMGMLNTTWNEAYKDLFHPGYYWKLCKYFFTYYTIPMIAYLLCMGYYIFRKALGKMVLLSVFLAGHILLINFTHVMDWGQSPYFERMYMPIIPIIFLPFLYDFFTQLALRNMAGGILLVLIVAWRMWLFTDLGFFYKEHTAHAEEAIEAAQKLPGSKFELHPDDFAGCMKYTDWSFTMESILRSSAIDKSHTVTICTWEDFMEHDNRNRLNGNDYMLRRWEVMPDYAVNENYFHIRDGKYVQLRPVCGNK